MSRPQKSPDPDDRMGKLNRMDKVRSRRRLHQLTDAYEGRDIWQEFCEKHQYEQGSYEGYEEDVDRVGNHWKDHMADRERHHALALPDDVEAWSAELLAEKSMRGAHDYWLRVREFYDWLQWQTEYPHLYHPVLMAAAVGDAAEELWEWKTKQTRKSRREYRRQNNE